MTRPALKPSMLRVLPALAVLGAAAIPLMIAGVGGWIGPAAARRGAAVYPLLEPRLKGNALKRQRLLTKIPGDPTALVNVRLEHLPATHEMTLLGKAALPALERGLTGNVNPQVRSRVAWVLEEFGDFRSKDALLAALKDWTPQVRRLAILALSTVGDRSVAPRLLKIMDDPEETAYNRNRAAWALGWIGATRGAPRLLAILANPKANYGMRHAALSSLWDLRHHLPAGQVKRALLLALKSKHSALQTFAAAGAAELRLTDGRLRAALVKRLRDRSADVRNIAVYALGEIGHRAAIAPLRKRIDSARSARLLNNIAFALRKLGDKQVMTLLARLLKHRLAVIRLNAAFVLGDFGDPGAIGLLGAALKDPNDFVRASAISAMGRIGHASASAHLTPLAASKNLSVRTEALLALNRITKGGYNDRIAKELLWHKNPRLHKRATLELARRGDPRAITPLLLCFSGYRCSSTEFRQGFAKLVHHRTRGVLLTACARRSCSSRLIGQLMRYTLDEGHRSILRGWLRLGHSRTYTRRSMLRLLGRLKDQSSLPAFWAHLKSRDPLTRYNAAFALANRGQSHGWKLLITALTQGAFRVKRGVADLLRTLSDPGAKKASLVGVRAALKGHGPFSRLAAAYALTAWKPAEGVGILVASLGSPNRNLRNEAAYYLMRPELKSRRGLIKKALATERRSTVRGTLRRILRKITPGTLKAKVLDRANL